MTRMTVGKGNVIPWTTDFSLVASASYASFVFVPPHGLQDFVSPDGLEDIRIIHGPKGSGKTSVLLAKHQAVEEIAKSRPREVISIPSRFPYIFLPPELSNRVPFQSWATIQSYAEESTWEALWVLIFGAYVFAALEREQRTTGSISSIPATGTLLPKALGDFLIPNYGATHDLGSVHPSEELVRILKHIISEKQASRKTLKSMFDDHLRSRIESLSQSERKQTIYIFVDAVDEIFGGLGNDVSLLATWQKGHHNNSGAIQNPLKPEETELIRTFWSFAQSSLLSATFNLGQISGNKIKLIASMRTEAYNFRLHSKGEGQLMSIVRAVRYAPSQLLEIVKANIEYCNKLSMASPSSTDPITRFFGKEKISHWKTREEESMFDWVLRHTMEEPRDLMVAFQNFALLDPEDRKDENEIITALRSASSVILKDYLNFLAIPWDVDIEDEVLPLISSNILRADELHGIAEIAKSKSNGKIENPFCYLYGLGLIGVPHINGAGNVVQKFSLPAKFPDRVKTSFLPNATHYLIHPILTNKIREIRETKNLPSLVTHGSMIVGNGRMFTLGIDLTRISIGIKEIAGGRPQAKVRIDGKDLGYDPVSSDSLNRFSSLDNVETVFFFTILLALGKRAARNPMNLDVSLDEIKEHIKFLIEKKFVAQTIIRRGRTSGFYEKIEAEFENYAGDCRKYPKTVQRVNARLRHWLAEDLRISIQSNRCITLYGNIRASDISVESFGIL